MAAEETQKDNSVVGLKEKEVVEVVLGLSLVEKEKEVEMATVAEEGETVAEAEEVKTVAAAMERMEKKEKVENLVMKVKEANGYRNMEENSVRKTSRNWKNKET